MLDETSEVDDMVVDEVSSSEMSLEELLSQPFCSAPNVISCMQRCRNQAPDGVSCRDACDVCVGDDSTDDVDTFVSGDVVREQDSDMDFDVELLDDDDKELSGPTLDEQIARMLESYARLLESTSFGASDAVRSLPARALERARGLSDE